MRRSAIFHALRSVPHMSDHLGLSSGRLNLFLGGGGELRRLDGQLLGQLAIAHDLNAVIDLLDDAVLDQLDGG